MKDQLSQLNEAQLKIITAVDNDKTHIDDIIEATGLGTATVLAQLTVLEIKGFIRREAGRRISLNTAKKVRNTMELVIVESPAKAKTIKNISAEAIR